MSIALNATGKVLALNAGLLMIHGSSFVRSAASPSDRMITYGDDLHPQGVGEVRFQEVIW